MASSYFLRASSPLKREEPLESMTVGEQETRSSETVKQKVRKNAKAATTKKKTAQRGMGVEQLERLRLQDRWKLISQPDSGLTSQNLQHPFHQFQFPFTYGVAAATEVPVSYRSGGGGAFASVNYGGASGDGQGQGQGSFAVGPYRYSNGGFAGVSAQTTLDAVPITPFEPVSSKELTSIQMMHCSSDHCDVCFKKKLINGESFVYNIDKPRVGMMNGNDYLGLSLGQSNKTNGNIKSELNANEGVEVMAVHRKRNAVKGESLLMEYEFFPHKASGSSSNNSTSYKDSEGTAGVFDISPSPSPSSTGTNPSFLDLSLKLSW